ncbi:MAG: thioredoxin fold domain-containing protein [Chloroflexi bacterium]|nr:thioredoxin fold domain-containing protein [Chloroflexota bacterium]
MNNSEFQQKLSESGKPVIVDFWAGWCAPCMVSKPILEKLAKEYAEQVVFLPVNADESREVLEQFRIFGIPTVITFRNGKEAGRITGSQPEAGYRAMFESLAEGKEVKIPLSSFDRMLRLGAGAAFMMIGISTGNWIIAGVGGILAFMGIYDRCPLWAALTGIIQKK